MGILTKSEIKKRIEIGDILINPFSIDNLNPNSYNLTLASDLIVYRNMILNTKKENETTIIKIESYGYTLIPNQLYLASTVEYTETYNLVPIINGRSSIGRLGLFVHVTAGFGDIGFKGNWTLELVAVNPIVIYPNMKICQIYYQDIVGTPENYQGKYNNNSGVQASQLFKEYGLNNG